MAILPLVAGITVLLDGRRVSAYASAYVVAGRTYAPLAPYVTRVADRLEYEGRLLVVFRGPRHATIRLHDVAPDALDRQYVALAPALRELGATVSYDAVTHTIEVRSPPPAAIASPSPFDPLAPQQAPRVVFTPSPSPAPPIVWQGPAIPRRTPLPYPLPT
jgi:hypothetical protein